MVAALTVLLAHRCAIDAGDPDAHLPRIASFGRWSDRIRSAVCWADPDRCDPWDGNAEVKENAQPEQVEALMFFEAWHRAFRTTQVSVKEIAQRCTENHRNYNADLAEAVKMLSISEPRGSDTVNTRALGQWLAAHKDNPGKFVLREGDKKSGKLYWYVEKTPPPSVEAVLESAVQNLIDVFPTMTDEQRQIFRTSFHDFEVAALSAQYASGQEFEAAIKRVHASGDDARQITSDPNATVGQRDALLRLHAIEILGFMACHMLPESAEYAAIRQRFNDMERIVGQESPALAYLKVADWELTRAGVPRHPQALLERAIELKNAELSRDPSKKNYYSPDIEDAMKELVGL